MDSYSSLGANGRRKFNKIALKPRNNVETRNLTLGVFSTEGDKNELSYKNAKAPVN